MKPGIHLFIRRILLLGLTPALIACQGTRPSGTTEVQSAQPPVVSATAPRVETTSLPATGTGQTGLVGRVIAESDVSGQPDEPLPNQMVLAVPVEKAPEILRVAGKIPTAEELRFLKANLPQADPAITVASSDADGNYTLILDPGEYVLCLADSDMTPPGFPATTRGCGLTQVPPGEQRRVDISSGFGEILLVEG